MQAKLEIRLKLIELASKTNGIIAGNVVEVARNYENYLYEGMDHDKEDKAQAPSDSGKVRRKRST